MVTLNSAQQDFHNKLLNEVEVACPVCDRSAHIQFQPFNARLAKLLKATYELFGQEWVPKKQLPKVPDKNGRNPKYVTNYCLMRHFGLFERHPSKPDWRVTDFGVKVLAGEAMIPLEVAVCMKTCVGRTDEMLGFATEYKRHKGDRTYQELTIVLPEVPDTITVDEARQQHSESLKSNGSRCVCCGRWNQVYKRPISKSMVRVLFRLYDLDREQPGKFFHVCDDVGTQDGEYGQMEFLGLIQASPDKDGHWRITDKGKAFREGSIEVPERVITLNDRLLGFSERTVSIERAAGKEFDLVELLAA